MRARSVLPRGRFPNRLLEDVSWIYAGIRHEYLVARLTVDEARRLQQDGPTRSALEDYMQARAQENERLVAFVLLVHDGDHTSDRYLTFRLDDDGAGAWNDHRPRLRLLGE